MIDIEFVSQTTVKKGEDHFGLALGIFGTIPLLIFSILYIISINKKKCGPYKVTFSNIS